MKKRTHRKLRIENLEERKLTAAVTWQLSSLFHAPQSGTALVSQPSAPSTSGLTYGSYNAGFKPGIAVNHNETLVRLNAPPLLGNRLTACDAVTLWRRPAIDR